MKKQFAQIVPARSWAATRCAREVESLHPTFDVVVYAGGQPRYALLVGVE